MRTNPYSLPFFALLCLLVIACGDPVPQTAQPMTTSPAAVQSSPGALLIKDQAKQVIGEISTSGTTVQLRFNGQQLTGKLSGDKRKYADGAGRVVAEVKSADADGFKLRNPDGSLRWKVKLYEDKVKISDNEENENPYQLKTSEGKYKVKDAREAEVGRIVQEGETIFVTSDQLQFVLQAPYRMSYGVLLIPTLSQTDQMILLAELQDRGY